MKNKLEYAAVFISPHLDDAVFSCAGKMAELASNKKILVINIFTSYDQELNQGALVFGVKRQEEEKKASQLLNYDYINLDEKDTYFRGSRKGSIAKVFYPPKPEDFIYLEKLRDLIFKELSKISFLEIYVPLAIGWNIDHYLIHLIFNEINGPYKDQLRFYEDAPYIFFPGAKCERLAYLQGQSTNFLSNLQSTSVAFFYSGFTQNIKKFPWRFLIMPYMFFYFMKLILMHRHFKYQNTFSHYQEMLTNCENNFELKIKGIMCYTSQIKEFFENENKVRESYFRYSLDNFQSRDHLERYWRPLDGDRQKS